MQGGGWPAHILLDKNFGRCGSHYKKPHLETRNQRNKHIRVHSNSEAKLRKTVFLLHWLSLFFPNQQWGALRASNCCCLSQEIYPSHIKHMQTKGMWVDAGGGGLHIYL